MALPADYAERLVSKLREEAEKSYMEKTARLEAKYKEYKEAIAGKLDEAAKTFAEKVKD